MSSVISGGVQPSSSMEDGTERVGYKRTREISNEEFYKMVEKYGWESDGEDDYDSDLDEQQFWEMNIKERIKLFECLFRQKKQRDKEKKKYKS